MLFFLAIILIYSLILILSTGAGIATGFLLHWMISSMSLEICILTGVISVNFSMFFFISLGKLLYHYEESQRIDKSKDKWADVFKKAKKRRSRP